MHITNYNMTIIFLIIELSTSEGGYFLNNWNISNIDENTMK